MTEIPLRFYSFHDTEVAAARGSLSVMLYRSFACLFGPGSDGRRRTACRCDRLLLTMTPGDGCAAQATPVPPDDRRSLDQWPTHMLGAKDGTSSAEQAVDP